jgi:hypothetical protein
MTDRKPEKGAPFNPSLISDILLSPASIAIMITLGDAFYKYMKKRKESKQNLKEEERGLSVKEIESKVDPPDPMTLKVNLDKLTKENLATQTNDKYLMTDEGNKVFEILKTILPDYNKIFSNRPESHNKSVSS